ncbi:MAG: ATP-binding protein [Hellea sp.]
MSSDTHTAIVSHALNSDNNLSLAESLAKVENLGYAKIGPDMILNYISPELYVIMGADRDIDLVGQRLDRVLSTIGLSNPKTNSEFSGGDLASFIGRSPTVGGLEPTTLMATTLDGRRVRVNTLYSENGELLTTVRDVSDERRKTSLLEMAMEAANAGFWSMSFDTAKFTYSDSVLRRLNPAEIEKIKTQGLWAIVHRDDLAELTKTWQKIVEGTAPFDFTYRVVTQGEGVMWQRSVGKIERGSDGRLVGATAFVRDITEDVKKQSDLFKAKEASKAKSEFLARMSHEIRTPLNAIIGMSDSLKDEPLSEDIMEVIEDIEQAAEGLHHLLSRTLDHAKLISDKMQIDLHRANVKEVITTSTKLWNPQCSAAGITLKTHYDPSVPQELFLDGFRLQQCLNNLLSNAVKFTASGRIDLIIKVTPVKERDSLVIAVKDTGIGMTSQQSASIFEAFSQADNSISRTYGGTGLGMSITKQLTELMGGEIRVKSAPDVGSTFMLILPILSSAQDLESTGAKARHQVPALVDTPPHAPTLGTISVTKKPFEGLSVLCVEDNPINQKVVKRLIGKRVANLTFANNGREALDILSLMHIDVVLMDIHMPVMDGIEATLEIRGSKEPWANVIIIALTADPDYQQKRICKNIGMDDTIAKPVKREDIFKAFDRTMGTISAEFSQPVRLTA